MSSSSERLSAFLPAASITLARASRCWGLAGLSVALSRSAVWRTAPQTETIADASASTTRSSIAFCRALAAS